MADEVDRLFSLPLEQFTRERNELAKRLKDPELRALKKPSVAAWAVNQLARRREVDVRRLLRAGEQLEAAQHEAVRGGDSKAFTRARRDERDAIRRLRSAAAELLREGGHPASDATLERVAKTLNAAAATEPGRAALRAGRLTEELEPQGFDALAALAGSIPKKQRAAGAVPKGPSESDRRRARKAKDEAKAARAAATEADTRLQAAERALREAEREAEQARKLATRAKDKAERLEEHARELAGQSQRN